MNKAEIIISVLKKLREIETLDIEEFRKMVGDPELFNLLTNKGYTDLVEERVTFDLESRLQISLIALRYGADIEKVCKLLNWREFEAFSKSALEKNNYFCIQNFRFKHNKKRYEIDVVGLKKPLILCIDSKHYKKSGKSGVLKVACKKQIERVEAFSRILPKNVSKLRIMEWKNANIIPLIVTLLPEEISFFEQVPIVPFFKLNSFIIELQAHTSEIYQIHKKLPEYSLLKDWNS
ncbi:MAG: nuclease-related domain-containing protein [Candidatus Lokiarchaeia archaeon]